MAQSVGKKAEDEKNKFLVFFTGFIRIRGVLNWLAISFFGFLLGITSLNITSYVIPFIVFLVTTSCILSFTFAINNYYDIETDRENPRRAHLNAIASGKISKQTGMSINIVFVIVSLVLSFLYSNETFLFCVLLVFWMGAYSAPPFRLKGRAGWDVLWHFVAFFALILWGAFLAGRVMMLDYLVAISFGLFGCFAQLDNHIRDYPFDKESGSRTFAVRIGLQKTQTALKIVFVFYLLSLVPLLVLYSFHSFLTGLILCGGLFLSLLYIQKHKSLDVSALYHVIYFFGGAVYLTCLLFTMESILSLP